MSINLSNRSPDEINQILADAWLNIEIDNNKIFNPLATIPADYEKEPHKFIAWLMTQPEYFSFLCKYILNVQVYPAQALILRELWQRKFPMLVCSRGWGKSYILALYGMIRLLLLERRKIAITGAAFRQAKVIFEYMETIWNNAPLLRDMCGSSSKNGPRREQDMYRFFIGESVASAYPLGDGGKIRGQRANDIFTDEFATINKDILENVIFGFAAVASNPVEKMQLQARKKKAKELGVIDLETENLQEIGNQIVIAGTAYYQFNHFYDYFQKWRSFITSRGNVDKIRHHFKDGDIGGFNWKDYSIIRVPTEMIPEGFMDSGIIDRAKATIKTGTYNMEYGACFSKDSTGFYKRSVIEAATVSETNPITDLFRPTLFGNPNCKYIYGIDPASEVDNFSIVVIELRDNHKRIVHAWSTNKKDHTSKLKSKATAEQDFYAYCVRKIRDLMKRFPCERIALDSQGGGVAIREALKNNKNIEFNEHPIYEVIDYDKPKDTDGMPGLHILELINFASAEWTGGANHGLKQDFENKTLIFPFFDSVQLGMSSVEDMTHGRVFDTLEDCCLEIEELKNELSNIIAMKTPNGRDKWDTPEKLEKSEHGSKKVRLRKDRYCALLMANAVANKITNAITFVKDVTIGGFANGPITKGGDNDMLYSGPDWFVGQMKGVY